jgi:acyl-CoA synthetase (AMP-forming)/AMP-acid ligase II
MQISFIHMAPPIGVFLAKSPLIDAADLSSFRYTMSGGAPLGVDVIEAVYRRTGILIRMGYGTSEAGSLTSQQGDTWEELQSSMGTAGKPLPGVQFKIVSPEDDKGAVWRAH